MNTEIIEQRHEELINAYRHAQKVYINTMPFDPDKKATEVAMDDALDALVSFELKYDF